LLNGVISSLGKYEEFPNSSVLAMENVKNCRTVVFRQWENGERLLTVVFQQWENGKGLLRSGVSAMGKMAKSC
jgi:hypothetical protein